MSPAPHHESLQEFLDEALKDDGGAEAEILRQLNHQFRAASALGVSLAGLDLTVTPEQAYRAQTTENVWRQISAEFGMLTAEQVAERVGATGRRSYASDARRHGRLLGVKRTNRILYPGFQLTETGPLPVIRQLVDLAGDVDVSERGILLWLTAPTTWWGDEARPIDHLDEPDELVRAFRSHFAATW